MPNMDELIAFGGEIKALGGGKITGLMVRFSTNADPDLTREYFSKATDLRLPETLDVYYNHGLDSTLKKRVIGKAKTRIDDVGAWADTQLNMRDEYEKAIYAMAEAGKLGYSTGALSHLVEREPDGKAMHIKTWAVGEVSLTPVPAEPRNSVVTLKSLMPDAALSDAGDDPTHEITPNRKKVKTMDEDEIKAIAVKAAADALAERDAQDRAAAEAKAAQDAAVKAAADAAYQKGVEETKALLPARYHSTQPTDDDNDGVQAFKAWMATGQENSSLMPDKAPSTIKAAWNVTTGASGAFLVPDPLYTQIIAKRDLASWIRQLPVQILQTSADHLLVPRENTKHTAFVQTAETVAYDENEGTVSQKDLILYKFTKLTKANEEFLNFEGTNWDAWFINAMARAVGVTENTIFTTGVGTTAPEGVLVGATVANTTATTDIILPSELAALIGYLGAGYNVPSECGFLMQNVAKWYLKGSGGTAAVPFAYIGTPAGGDFFGYPAVVDDDMEVYTTGSAKCVLFGNFNFYGVVERPGMSIQRNPWLYMATGQVGIFCNIYRGGGVLQSEAFYYLTNHS